jgi:hypothetical protein
MLPIDPEVLSLFVIWSYRQRQVPSLFEAVNLREDEPSFAYFQVAKLLLAEDSDRNP